MHEYSSVMFVKMVDNHIFRYQKVLIVLSCTRNIITDITNFYHRIYSLQYFLPFSLFRLCDCFGVRFQLYDVSAHQEQHTHSSTHKKNSCMHITKMRSLAFIRLKAIYYNFQRILHTHNIPFSLTRSLARSVPLLLWFLFLFFLFFLTRITYTSGKT